MRRTITKIANFESSFQYLGNHTLDCYFYFKKEEWNFIEEDFLKNYCIAFDRNNIYKFKEKIDINDKDLILIKFMFVERTEDPNKLDDSKIYVIHPYSFEKSYEA